MKRKPRVGDRITWRGQGGRIFRATVARITEPQIGNYVLWTRDDFPINYRQVKFTRRKVKR